MAASARASMESKPESLNDMLRSATYPASNGQSARHLSASFNSASEGPRKRSFFDFSEFSDDSEQDDDEFSDHGDRFDERAERILDTSLSLVAKVLVMLKSLRPHIPSMEEVASTSQTVDGDAESVSDDGHDAPSLDDPPAKRLEWCISRLEAAGTGAINSSTFAEEQLKRLVHLKLERSNASKVIDDHVMRWLESAMEPVGRTASSRQRSQSRHGSRGSLREVDGNRRVSHHRLNFQHGSEGDIGRRLSASLLRMQNIDMDSEPDTSLVHTLRRRRYVTVVPEETFSETLSDYPEFESNPGSRRVSDVQPEYFEHRRRSPRSSLRTSVTAVTEVSHCPPKLAPASLAEETEEDEEAHAVVPTCIESSTSVENGANNPATSSNTHTSVPPSETTSAAPTRDGSFDEVKGESANVAPHERGSLVFGHYWHNRPTRLGGNTGRIVRLRQASCLNGPAVVKLSPECETYLHRHDCWGINMLEVEAVSGCQPLVAMTMHAIKSRNLIERLKLDERTLLRYITQLENNYGRYPDLLYHNNVHAADVVQATHQLLAVKALSGVFSDVEVFCAIIAAAAHDVGHMGVNNLFLTATQSPLAVLYNDQSILENHHAATCFKLMMREECNIFASFSSDARTACRSIIIDMILATDMAKHFKYLTEFRNLLETRRSSSNHIDLLDISDDEKVLLLQTVVHCADLAGPTRPWEMSKIWAERIVNEFFQQGDRERELQLPLGPLNDRNKIKLPASQIGFIEFIVSPLWETWSEVINDPDCEPVRNMNQNRDIWAALKAEEDRLNGQPPSPTLPVSNKRGSIKRRGARHRYSRRHHSQKTSPGDVVGSSAQRFRSRAGSRFSTGSSAGGEDTSSAASGAPENTAALRAGTAAGDTSKGEQGLSRVRTNVIVTDEAADSGSAHGHANESSSAASTPERRHSSFVMSTV